MKILIKGGKTVDPQTETQDQNDVYIENGVISHPFKTDNSTVIIDATDKYIIPGLVDLHVHFRDPGLTHKEDIISGSRAAARGGFTTVCCMPNTIPSIDSTDTLEYVDKKGRTAGYVNVMAASAMTIGQKGKILCDFAKLNDLDTITKSLTGHGICAISEDGVTLADSGLMKEVCLKAKDLGLPVMDHAEPEIEIVNRDIELAKTHGCHIHIQHISKAASIRMIREAKADGIAVTCEATPHHFTLENSAIDLYGSNAKMNPPLGTEKDRAAVLGGLFDDTIDIIATDHAPHSQREKTVVFSIAPNGIIGLETAFPISYTILVESGLMSFNELIQKMSSRPLEIIGAKPTGFEVGTTADLAVADINNNFIINRYEFHSKGKNTPFHGRKVNGNIIYTIHNGVITWQMETA